MLETGTMQPGWLSCSYSEWEVKQVWVTFASKALPTTLSARYYSLIWQ